MLVRRIRLAREAADLLIRDSVNYFPLETGGILVGRVENSVASVLAIVGAGGEAQHAAMMFRRDGEYTQKVLDGIVAASKGEMDYLGEWHSHPLPQRASKQDRDSMALISSSPAYNLREPLLIISMCDRRGSWSLVGYQWLRVMLIEIPVEVAD